MLPSLVVRVSKVSVCTHTPPFVTYSCMNKPPTLCECIIIHAADISSCTQSCHACAKCLGGGGLLPFWLLLYTCVAFLELYTCLHIKKFAVDLEPYACMYNNWLLTSFAGLRNSELLTKFVGCHALSVTCGNTKSSRGCAIH